MGRPRHDVADGTPILTGMGNTGQYGVVAELYTPVETGNGPGIVGVFTAATAYGHGSCWQGALMIRQWMTKLKTVRKNKNPL